MKRLFMLCSLGLIWSSASAQDVIHIKCVGTDANGHSETFYYSYNPDEGWVSDGVIRFKSGVSATQLRHIEFKMDRETGKFVYKESTSTYEGFCTKVETKF